ncbi:hypothetical protein EOL96_08885 [Candidatus Saccharibacteria bacterium]|nr:hypothetical protein [Candidatus Saccharibacteria bacterium]
MTSSLAQLQKVPGLNVRNDLPFSELADVLEGKPDVAEEQKKLVDAHGTDPAQDRYPVIVVETENGLFEVIDGNRRTLKALLYGNNTIDAWVGNTNKSAPTNFWVPLNDMFQLVKVYKQAVGACDEELKVATARVLKARFESSNVAKIAYQNRIGNQTKLAGELSELAQSL